MSSSSSVRGTTEVDTPFEQRQCREPKKPPFKRKTGGSDGNLKEKKKELVTERPSEDSYTSATVDDCTRTAQLELKKRAPHWLAQPPLGGASVGKVVSILRQRCHCFSAAATAHCAPPIPLASPRLSSSASLPPFRVLEFLGIWRKNPRHPFRGSRQFRAGNLWRVGNSNEAKMFCYYWKASI